MHGLRLQLGSAFDLRWVANRPVHVEPVEERHLALDTLLALCLGVVQVPGCRTPFTRCPRPVVHEDVHERRSDVPVAVHCGRKKAVHAVRLAVIPRRCHRRDVPSFRCRL
ncbi:hypothetical protein LIP_1015 [Limnochorda pilosa]|uniref:Uncharacterized protein n=1 Tax=Limnochorda pilosa TaxID=1555112 RepID=A0A0K2SIM0_LIMPI|nr:hypothetical protein LIP_1015 [Limnochorda pilosa]